MTFTWGSFFLGVGFGFLGSGFIMYWVDRAIAYAESDL